MHKVLNSQLKSNARIICRIIGCMGIVIFHHITWHKINYCDIVLYAFISIYIITIPFGFAKTINSEFPKIANYPEIGGIRKIGNSDFVVKYWTIRKIRKVENKSEF